VRIGIDISFLHGGSVKRGIGRYTLQQLEATINEEHEFFLFHQPFPPHPELPDSITRRKNVKVVALDFPEAVSLLDQPFSHEGEQAYTEAIQRFVAPYQLDLYHLTSFDENVYHYSPRVWTVCPLVMTVYDFIPLQLADFYLRSPVASKSYFLALTLMRDAQGLIVISETIGKQAVELAGVNPEHVFVAPPHADDHFQPPANKNVIPALVEKIGAPYFYALSSLGPHKNLRTLIQAFALLTKKTDLNIKLAVSASIETDDVPKEMLDFVRKAGVEGRVVWMPKLEDRDIANLYQYAMACIHVSTIEGFGLPILEAMQCGTPVITSNHGAMLEVAGDAARLVKADDIGSIVQGMAEVLTDETLRERLSQSGLERSKYYNATRLGEDTWRAYRQITATRQKTSLRDFDFAAGQTKGINLIGDLRSDKGLGEIARNMASMFLSEKIPISYEEVVVDPDGRTTQPPPHLATGLSYPINVIHISAPFIEHLIHTRGFASHLKDHYNIGYWFYEQPQLPPSWAKVADDLDEIWVATHFVREAAQSITKTPVYVLPTPIPIEENITANRAAFNLPEDGFIFLFSFNPGSSAGRKNPFGLLDAYEKAFGHTDQRPLLVLKAQFLDKFPELAAELRKRSNRLGVYLLEDNVSRREMYQLIASCDCYISLHRSEGWGLGMAEAMALSKPVIGTGWSGNIDFMSQDNSYLVDYKLVKIKAEHHRFQELYLQVYPPGSSVWAEPDIQHAAELMRHVVENPQAAAEKGRRAAKTIREEYNPIVLGQRIKAHLQTIDVSRGKYYNAPQETTAPSPPLPPSQAPAQVTIPGVNMHHLQAAYHGWNRERLRTTIRGFGGVINRIPVIGFIFRTLVRLRNLGKVWGAESVLLEALIHEAEVAQAKREEIYAAVNAIQNQLGQLNGSIVQQISETLRDLNTGTQHTARQLNDLNTRYADMTSQLHTLRDATSRQFRAVNATVESRMVSINQRLNDLYAEIQRLNDGQLGLDERTRLNTSQLRLLLLEMADSLGEHFTPAPLKVVRWLEATVPVLAQSQRVDFTLQGMVDEGQMLALGAHWRGRLANIQPEIWYHFDCTDHWQGEALYNDAQIKLTQGGFLVVVVSAPEVVWPQREGFKSAQTYTFGSNGSTAHIAIYQKC
jgi:glycosyltransferase involved in cell wall biosynthesis